METSNLEGKSGGGGKVGKEGGWEGEAGFTWFIQNEKEQRGFSLAAPAANGEIKSSPSRRHHSVASGQWPGPRVSSLLGGLVLHCSVSVVRAVRCLSLVHQPFWRVCELSRGLQIKSCST